MSVEQKVKLTADTTAYDNSVEKSVRSAESRMGRAAKKTADDVAVAAKKAGDSWEKSTAQAVKHLATLEMINKAISGAKKLMDWTDEWAEMNKGNAALEDQIQAWQTLKSTIGEATTAVKSFFAAALTSYALWANEMSKLPDFWEKGFWGNDGLNGMRMDEWIRRSMGIRIRNKQAELDWLSTHGVDEGEPEIITGTPVTRPRRTPNPSRSMNLVGSSEFPPSSFDAQIPNFNAIFAASPSFGGLPMSDAEKRNRDTSARKAEEFARLKEALDPAKLAVDELRFAFDALGSAVGSAFDAWITGSQSWIAAFKSMMAETFKGEAVLCIGKSIEAGAEALINVARGNWPGAAIQGKAAAAYAGAAVVFGGAAKGMYSAGWAGGGATPSATSYAGGSSARTSQGPVTYVINVNGVLGDKAETGAYITEAVKSAREQGRVLTGDSAAEWD